MPACRAVVIDDHHLAAGARHPQRLGQRGAAHRLGLLVQQEEQQRGIDAGIGEMQRARVLAVQPHRRIRPQLAAQVGKLDRRHVHHVQPTFAVQAGGDALGEVAIHAGDLQHLLLDVLSEFGQRGIAQAGEVAPQDQVHQPFALEHAHRVGMQIRPPVNLLQVGGDARSGEPCRRRGVAVDRGDDFGAVVHSQGGVRELRGPHANRRV